MWTIADDPSTLREYRICVGPFVPTILSRKKASQVADSTFEYSGHLARHVKIHSGEKPFSCPLPGCTSRFSRHDNMLQHYRAHMRKLQ
ncbi:hypothetical protein DFS34DRAFT_578440, partial [Phlyctochytrium arcticum]